MEEVKRGLKWRRLGWEEINRESYWLAEDRAYKTEEMGVRIGGGKDT